MAEVDLNGPEVHLDESDEQELLAASEAGDELEIHTDDYFADEAASEINFSIRGSENHPPEPSTSSKDSEFTKPFPHRVPRKNYPANGNPRYVRKTQNVNPSVFTERKISPTNELNPGIFLERPQEMSLPNDDLRFLIERSRDNSRSSSAVGNSISDTTPESKNVKYENINGPENANFFLDKSWKKEVQIKDKNFIKDDDSDDEIEVVGMKTNNKTFFAVKDEIKEEEKKIQRGKTVDATGELLSMRFARFQEEARNEIQYKEPSRTQEYLKGSIKCKKFTNLQRNLKRNQADFEQDQEVKRQKILAQCIQVVISDLPTDWIEEGVQKIISIANAYGPGSDIVETVIRPKDTNDFVVIFKESRYAYDLYQGLNGRNMDETQITVTVPSPRTY